MIIMNPTDAAYMLTERMEQKYEALRSVLPDMFPDIFQISDESIHDNEAD